MTNNEDYTLGIKEYLDSTYLKTAEQTNVSEEENIEIVKKTIQEAIDYEFKLVMIRPEIVSLARNMIDMANAKVLVGTVVDFPFGNSSVAEKLTEAKQSLQNGADELDFVIDYTAFKNGITNKPKQEVLECSKLVLNNGKVIKWIIETAALSPSHIAEISTLIKEIAIANFDTSFYEKIFVKSSTGFYKTPNGKPNGATPEAIKLMIENSFPLPVKAAGGVRNIEEAKQMIELGVKRIGTSSAKNLV